MQQNPKQHKTKYLSVKKGRTLGISQFPNFHRSGNIRGMKEKYYGISALLVKCGSYIYNVTADPSIYEAAH